MKIEYDCGKVKGQPGLVTWHCVVLLCHKIKRNIRVDASNIQIVELSGHSPSENLY